MAWLLTEVSIQCKKRGKLVALALEKHLTRVIKFPKTRRYITITLLIILAYASTVLIPAGLYAYSQEGWYYNTAHYYCFITLSTIGFGDVMPYHKDSNSRYYRLLMSFYLVYGLAVIAIVLNVVQQVQKRQAKKILKCCAKTSQKIKQVNQQENDETEVQNSALITDVKSIRRTFSLDDSSSSPLRKIMETIPSKSPADDEDHCDKESHFVDGKICPKPEYSLVLYETAM